jgi:FAD/FMN-containing dehydrogenase
VPTAAERTTALLAVDSAADAVACLVAARGGSPSLDAAELVFADGVALVCEHLGVPEPFPGRRMGAFLLLEVAAATDPTDELLAALGPVADRIADTAIATTSTRREDLWRYREAHTEAVNALGVPHKLDVTLPLGGLAAFCDDVRAVVEGAAPGARTILFGPAGDGNVHVNVVGPAPDDDAVDAAVLGLVAARGGSISAEHGIGTAKRAYLHLSRSPEEIAAFRALKRALDPAGILNPAALLPPEE